MLISKNNPDSYPFNLTEAQAIINALQKDAIISVTNHLHKILYVNERFLTVFKYTRDEVTNADYQRFSSYKENKDVYAKIFTSLNKGEIWHGEWENTINDGSHIWLDTTVTPIINSDPAKTKYIAISFDISERKALEKAQAEQLTELEKTKSAMLNMLEDLEEDRGQIIDLLKETEKFKLAVENADDHVIITDEDGIILYANDAVTKLTGYAKGEVIGKKAGSSKLWGGLMDADFYKSMWQTLKTDKKTFTGLIHNKRKNGEEYYAESSISPVLDDKGEVEFFVGIERDVTQEKQIDKAKSEFVSLASHQLRTPITGINWYVEVLLGDSKNLTPEQIDYLQEIQVGSKRMNDLINAMLNLSRIELNTFAVDPEPTDIDNLMEGVIKEQRPQITQRNITLSYNKPTNLPTINIDPKLCWMMFQNLLSNAIKYSHDTGEVKISLKKYEANSSIDGSKLDQACICAVFEDKGIGIPLSQQGQIFTKLFRADNATSLNVDGNGLGLYLVKSIIEHSGGKVWFTSEEGKGTKFYLAIPIAGMKAKEGTRKLS